MIKRQLVFLAVISAGTLIVLVLQYIGTTSDARPDKNETPQVSSEQAAGNAEVATNNTISGNDPFLSRNDDIKEERMPAGSDAASEAVADSVQIKKEEKEEKVEEAALPDIAPPAAVGAETEDEKNETSLPFNFINEETRKALVNILCTTKFGGSLRPITGSGVIIDERGVILTNAHIAQYLLLKDYQTKDFIDCVVRQGSPARPLYKAELLYISPEWIADNAAGIKLQEPKGTGENDYAFLLITGHVNQEQPLPEIFPFAELNVSDETINIGNNVLLAGYPAGFLGGIAVQKDLYITSTVTQIQDIFTFSENTLDLFSIGGSIVAQQGSSGGAVVSGENKLLGIIVTSSSGNTTQERDLRAITVSHINNSLLARERYGIDIFLGGDLGAQADAFNSAVAPGLIKLLTDELDK
jgi:S1-C subfamily serine protease